MELDNKTDGTPIKHTAVIKNLREELDTLRELNKHRERAKELRKQGLRPLRKIGDIKEKNTGSKEREITNRPLKYNKKDERDIDFTTWTTSGDEVEIALLAKIQNHRDISDNDNDNNVAEASVALRQQLAKMKLNGDLMPLQSDDQNNDDQNNDDQNNNDNWTSVPVMTAARSMQVLTSRSETTLSRASMICYYRILREIYGAGTPDWTVGAARAGIEGKTSAFVTAECIRAIFTFRDSIKRTVIFFRETKKLLERYESLLLMTKDLKGERRKNHPLRLWADKTMDAMWLDWFLSTNQRKGQIVLFYNSNTNKSKQKTYDISKNDDDKVKIDSISEENDSNQLFQFNTTKENDVVKVTVKDVGEFFNTFLDLTKKSIDEAITHVKVAKKEIVAYRKEERKNFSKPDDNYEAKREAKRKFNRTMSSHTFALDKIEGSIRQLQNTKNIINSTSETGGEKLARLKNILGDLARESEKSVAGLNRVIAPTRQYIKTVIRRELSNPDDLFDAGELVFAAGTFGAMTNWQQDLLLNRACDKLVKALPESGRFLTKRPLHTTIGGYRMLPIGCEMTRCFAFLLTNMNYEFDSQLVGRMINIFEEALIPLLNDSYEKNTFIAWNFDSSPKPDKPSVWVSSVAVLALDQMVKMLDMRINRAVIRHFESIAPEKPHTDLPINDLIFADYGFDNYFYAKHKDDYPNARQISIQLELMRAQVMRASLPEFYPEDIEGIYSLILYGPPGTGKTTLAEVLAVNSEQYVVKLSPSDLNVEGEALIEGRARDVFEALTMLTQTVIIFDEFEPMVQSRQIDETAEEINETEEDRINRGFNKLAKELREIRRKEDPKYRFLLAGMLPKFLKLHDAAKEQSLVYFGATNVLKDVDSAAKRRGRFDSKMPIYPPCPLSRAGSFLYKLCDDSRAKEKLNLFNDKNQLIRFLDVVLATANEPASELAQVYFNSKKSKYFDYVLDAKIEFKPNQKANEKIKKMVSNYTGRKEKLEKEEIREYDWLIKFEKDFKNNVESHLKSVNDKKIIEFLSVCLRPESKEAKGKSKKAKVLGNGQRQKVKRQG